MTGQPPTGAQAQQYITDLASALRRGSLALDPLIARLERDGRSDDANLCKDAAADLLTLSSQANAIAVSTIVAAAAREVADLKRVNAQLETCAQRLARDEANVTRFVRIAAAATDVVTGFTTPGGLIAAGTALATLTALLEPGA